MLLQMAKMLDAQRSVIPAYYDYPISTGLLKEPTTRLRPMKRQVYGFRDDEFFKRKILEIHVSRYTLAG